MVASRISDIFQSTLPVWGGTSPMQSLILLSGISIHPPRVGRDGQKFINPAQLPLFQSTLPVWGGTFSAIPQ